MGNNTGLIKWEQILVEFYKGCFGVILFKNTV